MVSVPGVCNIALSRIGETQFIDNLEEDTAPARVCNVLWEFCRNVVNESFPWVFATAQEDLSALDDDYAREGWTYAYALPSDCVTVLRLYSGSRQTAQEDRPPFALEGHETLGRLLLSDWEDPTLIYIRRVEDITKWSHLAIDALAWRLASELALAVPNKAQLAGGALQSYYAALAKAGSAEFRQGQEDVQLDSEFVRIR